jgi:ABC-type transporter Mla maintaining outer membrane lipid asymmetry permease subunit MlaE
MEKIKVIYIIYILLLLISCVSGLSVEQFIHGYGARVAAALSLASSVIIVVVVFMDKS